MGSCNSTTSIHPGDQQSYDISRSIDNEIRHAAQQDSAAVKCVLLGAGECGKSTILKQMKILHLNGYTEDEKLQYKQLIWKNTIESIHTLINAVARLNINIDDTLRRSDIIQHIKSINSNDINTNKLPYIHELIHTIWCDRGIQRCYERSNEYYLLDSAQYFISESARTFSESYIPTDQDILRTRVATTGIIETSFEIANKKYSMYDVGGQRGERRKWIHCFENVTAVMFIASLSEYDQVLAEDRTRNRLNESLDLFEGIINLPWFEHTPIILFLNKNDIFTDKIKSIDLGIFHPQYVGGLNYNNALQYIQNLYFQRNTNNQKTIYCHVTDATDTTNIQFVWKSTKHIILEQMLATNTVMM